MNTPESVALFLTEGSSDKEYHIHLREKNGGWAVDYQNGRRGATLANGTKTAEPVDFASARKIFDKLKAEKMKKGYTPDGSGEAFRDTPDAGRASGVRLQLANSIDDGALNQMLNDDNWVAQEKHDGERRGVVVDNGKAVGLNRDGLTVALPESMAAALVNSVPGTGRWVMDGEIMGGRLVLFDLLERDGVDLRMTSVDDRLLALHELTVRGPIEIVHSCYGAAAKTALLDACRADRREGVVFKHRNATYVGDRPASGGDWLKYKFVESATLRVGAGKANKRSVSLFTDDDTAVGNVTVPVNQAIPASGDFVEVNYLYFFENGSLFQPTLKGPRADKAKADTTASLKRKNESITTAIVVGVQRVIKP